MLKPIDVELYSLREYAEKDFAGVLKRVAAIGYKAVEPAGIWNLTPAELGVDANAKPGAEVVDLLVPVKETKCDVYFPLLPKAGTCQPESRVGAGDRNQLPQHSLRLPQRVPQKSPLLFRSFSKTEDLSPFRPFPTICKLLHRFRRWTRRRQTKAHNRFSHPKESFR